MSVYFSDRYDLCILLLHELGKAKESMWIASTYMPDGKVLSAINKFSEDFGCQVLRGVFDEKSYMTSRNEKAKKIFCFDSVAVCSKNNKRMNENFIIIDCKTVVQMSFSTAFEGFAGSLAVFNNVDVVKDFCNWFDSLCGSESKRNFCKSELIDVMVDRAESGKYKGKLNGIIISICKFYRKNGFLTEKQFNLLNKTI